MAKSSINFQKSSAHSSAHNLRIDEPFYLLPREFRLENEFWQNSNSEKELFELELRNSKPKGGPKPKFENSRWEAVLNLNKNHSLEDVQKIAKRIEKKFNITLTEISIHRDEGHINEEGKPIYNFHAHLNFLTYKNGKQNWRKELIKPAALSELQTEVSQILGMERGKVNSKAKRLDHRQYKAVAQEIQHQRVKITAFIQANRENQTKLVKNLPVVDGVKFDDDTDKIWYARILNFIRDLNRRIKALVKENEELRARIKELEAPKTRTQSSFEQLQKMKSSALTKEEISTLQELARQGESLSYEEIFKEINMSEDEKKLEEMLKKLSKNSTIISKTNFNLP